MISDDPFVDDFGDDDDFDEVMLQGIEEIELQQGSSISNNTGMILFHVTRQIALVAILMSMWVSPQLL